MIPASGGESRGAGRRFVLKQRIGAGAFGEVFLAEQDSGAGFRRPVALKLLNPDVAGSREAARRMRDEARILGRLAHRNIVSVLDLVSFGDRWGVVMDYIPGADLEQVMAALEQTGGSFPVPAALDIGSAVCRALHAAYNADDGQGGLLRVVHRDIKPSNVRLTDDGEVKVLDFGVARVDLDTREAHTRARGWIGTERYMAPERILMEGDSAAGDLYALGASIVEILLLRPLGRTPVLPEKHQALVEEALAEVRARLTGAGPYADEVVALLRGCLAGDPKLRPSAAEAAARFGELARRVDGDSLSAFSERFVPRVSSTLGSTSEPASGVLTENQTPHTSIIGTSKATPSIGGAPTFFPTPDADTAARSAPAPWLVGLVAGLLALFLFVSVAIALLMIALPNNQTSTPVPAPTNTAPVPVPVPVVAPLPVPAVEPAPEPIVAAPIPLPRPGGTVIRPAPVPVPPPVPDPVPSGPRIRRALFVMQDASAIEVTCGDRSGAGTSSAAIADFPVGLCTVRATYLGSTLTARVAVDRAKEIRCRVSEGALSCD